MAARRGKKQARRNNGSGPFPGWAWMVLGIGLTVAVVLALPYLKGDGGGDGFLRPQPDPEAMPATSSEAGDEPVAGEGAGDELPAPKPTQYDFYTLLPSDEVAMTDAELAATARAEEAADDDDAAEPADAPDAAAVLRAVSTFVHQAQARDVRPAQLERFTIDRDGHAILPAIGRHHRQETGLLQGGHLPLIGLQRQHPAGGKEGDPTRRNEGRNDDPKRRHE